MGNIEEEFTLQSETLEYLLPQTLANTMPVWAGANVQSQIMGSLVEYVRGSSDPQTAGLIRLNVKQGILSNN